jgi:AcrR family transcriptional regulator
MPTTPRALPSIDLPVVGSETAERADAARNRDRILCAARRLLEERPLAEVSMDDVAAAAGVGKGTLFRRFGDRAGLLRSLLNEREADFQEQMIRGEPPLGPGAPPVERLVAFGRGFIDMLEDHGELLFGAESRQARFRSEVYAVHRAHVSMLIREARPDRDADYLADSLLAPLSADVFLYMRRVRELPVGRIAAGYEELVRSVLGD